MSPRDRRDKRDLHALDDDGMLVCNLRDREAAWRVVVQRSIWWCSSRIAPTTPGAHVWWSSMLA